MFSRSREFRGFRESSGKNFIIRVQYLYADNKVLISIKKFLLRKQTSYSICNGFKVDLHNQLLTVTTHTSLLGVFAHNPGHYLRGKCLAPDT